MKSRSNMSRRYPNVPKMARHKQGPYIRGPHLYGKAQRRVMLGEGYDRFMESVCERMRCARLEQEISVDELAAAIGVTPQLIHRYENPNTNVKRRPWPTLRRIVQICKAIGVMPLDLMPSEET